MYEINYNPLCELILVKIIREVVKVPYNELFFETPSLFPEKGETIQLVSLSLSKDIS